MMPDEIQGLIMEFKEKKEIKYNRVMKLVKQKQEIEEQLGQLQDSLEKFIQNGDISNISYRNMLKKYEATQYAYATAKAWIELESQYEYEDPRNEMSITQYVMAVHRLSKNVTV